MRRPVEAPMSFGFGLLPTDPQALAIYQQLGIKGHDGEDYAVGIGTPLYAVCDATVEWAGAHAGGYGIGISLLVAWNSAIYQVQYAHCSSVVVAAGQAVTEGQLVGYSGATGDAAGPHLHFALRKLGAPENDGLYGFIDPEQLFQGGADMNYQEIVMQALEAIQGVDPATYPQAALDGHVARLQAGTSLEEVLQEFIHDAPLFTAEEANVMALEAYATADHLPEPHGFATQKVLDQASPTQVLTEVLTALHGHIDRLTTENGELAGELFQDKQTITQLQDVAAARQAATPVEPTSEPATPDPAPTVAPSPPDPAPTAPHGRLSAIGAVLSFIVNVILPK